MRAFPNTNLPQQKRNQTILSTWSTTTNSEDILWQPCSKSSCTGLNPELPDSKYKFSLTSDMPASLQVLSTHQREVKELWQGGTDLLAG